MRAQLLTLALVISGAALAAAEVAAPTVATATVRKPAVPAAAVAAPDFSPSAWHDDGDRGSAAEFPAAVPFVPPTSPLRMIEFSSPDEVAAAAAQARNLRAQGGTAWFGWSPRDGVELHNPADIEAAVAELAVYCSGFAPAWRRSGAHYAAVSAALRARLAQAARRGNPAIQLFGEVYAGELEGGTGSRRVAIYAPSGVSAVLVVNAASPHLHIDAVRRAVSGLPLIAVLAGGDSAPAYRYRVRVSIENDN